MSGRRKLIMIALDWTRPKDPPLSLGHASILAFALNKQIQISERSWAVNSPNFKVEDVVSHIVTHSDLNTDIAFGVYVWNESAIQTILKELAIYSRQSIGRIILGGPQISYTKSSLEVFYPQADVFIRGFAESALVQLNERKDAFDIPGVHFAGHTDRNIQATIDLESLPSPYLDKVILPQRFIRWETQRGCKFRCTFCQHREPKSALARSKAFALERVHEEAEWILRNNVIQDIAVLDPVFNSGSHYLGILRRLRGYTGKIALQARMEMVNQDFLNEVCEINRTGNVVLEFGLQTIHKTEAKLIDRGNNMSKVLDTLERTRDLGISTELSLIFGLPGQTLDSFQQSIDFCKQQGVNTIHAFPLMLLRGTPLYENKEALGLLESNEVASEHIPRVQHDVIPHVVQSKTFSYSDWKKMAELAGELETGYNKGTTKGDVQTL